jgi:hypothetical protein
VDAEIAGLGPATWRRDLTTVPTSPQEEPSGAVLRLSVEEGAETSLAKPVVGSVVPDVLGNDLRRAGTAQAKRSADPLAREQIRHPLRLDETPWAMLVRGLVLTISMQAVAS